MTLLASLNSISVTCSRDSISKWRRGVGVAGKWACQPRPPPALPPPPPPQHVPARVGHARVVFLGTYSSHSTCHPKPHLTLLHTPCLPLHCLPPANHVCHGGMVACLANLPPPSLTAYTRATNTAHSPCLPAYTYLLLPTLPYYCTSDVIFAYFHFTTTGAAPCYR